MQSGSFNISLTYNQIRELVNQLPKKEKVRLGKELAKEATDQRLTRLLNSFRTDDLTQEDIDKELESVRAELYAKNKKD